jgi:putative ABC transport system substrate-binding protein
MARFGHPAMSAVRSLSGANRTSQMRAHVAIDPERHRPEVHVAVAKPNSRPFLSTSSSRYDVAFQWLGAYMRRREFLYLLLGGAVAGPSAARAQQQALPVVGFLRSTSLSDAGHLVAAFRKGLDQAGFSEGKNVQIELRSANGKDERLPELVAELIGNGAKAIGANLPSAKAAKAVTTTVPIVFGTGGDPIRDGLVESFNRPGGNLTGIVYTSIVGSKRLEQLRQIVPKASIIGALVHLGGTEAQQNELNEIKAAAQSMDQKLSVYVAKNAADIDAAFSKLVQDGAGAVVVGSGAFLNSHRHRVVQLAARFRLPASYNDREFVEIGGLMSYGASITDGYRQMGIYAGRILKGERPNDLPVMAATKIEFVINMKAAVALGLTFPPMVLATADEVIE